MSNSTSRSEDEANDYDDETTPNGGASDAKSEDNEQSFVSSAIAAEFKEISVEDTSEDDCKNVEGDTTGTAPTGDERDQIDTKAAASLKRELVDCVDHPSPKRSKQSTMTNTSVAAPTEVQCC